MTYKSRHDKSPRKGPIPQGRKGKPNADIKLAREAIAAFVDLNSEKLGKWLDEIYLNNGGADGHGAEKAFAAFVSLVEYRVPKLARVENKNEVEAEVTIRWGGEG